MVDDAAERLSPDRTSVCRNEILIGRRFVGTVIVAVALLALDSVTPPGLAIWLLQVLLMWITSRWANRRQIRVIAVLCTAFTVILLVVATKRS